MIELVTRLYSKEIGICRLFFPQYVGNAYEQ